MPDQSGLQHSLSLPWVGKITDYPVPQGQEWGANTSGHEPFIKSRGTYWHTGIDFDMDHVALLAMGNGEVIYAAMAQGWDAYPNGGYGRVLKIRYDNGLISYFAHLSGFAPGITQGVRVTRGEIVATSGGARGEDGSGNSTGPHLHLGIFIGNTDYNPRDYIKDAAGVATGAQPTPGVPGQPPAKGSIPATQPTPITIPNEPSLGLAPATIKVSTFAEQVDHISYRPFKPSTLLLWVSGIYIPVITASITLTNYLTPGSFNATISLDWLDQRGNKGALAALLAKQQVQVKFFGGYVDDILHMKPSDLYGIYTGVTDPPELLYDVSSGTATLSGPDLSGLLSADANTLPSLDPFSNYTPAQLAAYLANRHGLSYRVATTPDTIGSMDSANLTGTRTAGQTEWDTLTTLAQDVGFVVYMNGSTLNFVPPPALTALPPSYVIKHGKFTTHDQPTMSIQFAPQPHTQRDYRIVVTSYHTTTQQNQAGSAKSNPASPDSADIFAQGNPDTLQVITIYAPVNTSQETMDRMAKTILAQYQATEVLMTVNTAGVLPVTRDTPLIIQSDRIPNLNGGKPYYPVKITYSYQQGAGLTQSISCTTRPFGIQTADSTSSLGSLGL